MNERPNRSTSMISLLAWGLAFFGAAAYFASEQDYVATVLLVSAGLSGFMGYWWGAITMLSSVLAVSAAIYFAPSIGMDHEFRFTQWFGTTGLTNRMLSVLAVGTVISVTVSLLIVFGIGRPLRQRPHLDRINRWMGFVLGIAQGAAAVALLLGGILMIEPSVRARSAERKSDEQAENAISNLILETAKQTHASQVGPLVKWMNPFVRIPEMNIFEDVQRSAQVLSNPAKIQQLLHHPSIQELQQRPEVRSVVAQLKADTKVQELLKSGQPLNRDAAMTLLNHPAVLQLVDQPGFLKEAARVIQSTSFNAM